MELNLQIIYIKMTNENTHEKSKLGLIAGITAGTLAGAVVTGGVVLGVSNFTSNRLTENILNQAPQSAALEIAEATKKGYKDSGFFTRIMNYGANIKANEYLANYYSSHKIDQMKTRKK
jgi:hypothetical protein